MRPITEIIVHCSDTPPDWMGGEPVEAIRDEITRWHVQDRGWSGNGYNEIIGRGGDRAIGRDLDDDGDSFEEIGAHTRGHNARSLGVCLIGGHGSRADDPFLKHFTPEQDRALRAFIAECEERFGPLKISGHNQYAVKACPGFNVSAWFDRRAQPAPSSALLKIGSRGPDVQLLQERLNDGLYHVGAEDGVFGGRTDDGVRAFQRDQALAIDGMVAIGGQTWTALAAYVAEGGRRPLFKEREKAGVVDLAKKGSRIADASVKGGAATIASTVGAGGVVLADASDRFADLAGPLRHLTEPFGGPGAVAMGLLALAAIYSAVQHFRAGAARAADHRNGKTS